MKGMATAILGCTVIWSACQTNSSGAVDSSTAVACRVPQDSILAGLEAQNAHFRGVGGGAAAVSIDGHLVFSGAFGLADVEHDVPMSASESRFQVASVMKALTAATALKLHEKGVLSLDAPVSRYIEDFPESPGGATTVRLLAGHLGGIRHYRDGERDANFFARHYDSAIQALSVFDEEPYEYPPGTRFVYSSYGYNLLAAVIEEAAGLPFTTVVEEEILEPLGLTQTQFDNVRRPLEHRVRGYTYYYPWFSFEVSDQILRAPELDLSYNAGGGNLVSTATDLARFGHAFLRPGLLRPASLELVRTPIRSDSLVSSWGFGWQVSESGSFGGVVLTAEGSVPGFQANVQVYPEDETVAVLLSNSWGVRSSEPPPLEDPVRWLAESCLSIDRLD